MARFLSPRVGGVAPLLCGACSLLLIALALLATVVGGRALQPRWAVIAGDSMAPTLHDRHLRAACLGCGFPIECGLMHPPDRGLAFCTNCGFRETPVDQSHRQPADRVPIAPLPLAGPIERFDVIAFRTSETGPLAVKRVLGLPGERLSLAGGEVFADGRLVQKSPARLREVAITVHDNAFRPTTPHDGPRWRAEAGELLYHARGAALLRGAIVYEHRWPSAVVGGRPGGRKGSAPVRDLDAYNQSLSRRLNPMSDLMLSGSLRAVSAEAATLACKPAGQPPFALEIAGREVRATWRSGGRNHSVALGRAAGDRWHRFSLAVCDGQMLLAFDDRSIAVPLGDSPSAGAMPPNESPQFRLTSAALELRGLCLERDIYYLPPLPIGGGCWSLGRPLAADEYFVLGDNAPVSIDSRQWNGGPRRADIVGKVLPQQE